MRCAREQKRMKALEALETDIPRLSHRSSLLYREQQANKDKVHNCSVALQVSVGVMHVAARECVCMHVATTTARAGLTVHTHAQ